MGKISSPDRISIGNAHSLPRRGNGSEREARCRFRYALPVAVVVTLGAATLSFVPTVRASGSPLTLVSFSATPATVVAGSSVTIQWQLQSAAGVRFTTILVVTSDGNSLPSTSDCGGSGASLSFGDAEDGTYSETCTIPTAVPNGTYTVEVQAQDSAGNVLDFDSAGTFIVTGGEDVTSGPTFVSFTASPVTVVAGSSVQLEWQLESVAGVSFTTIFVKTSDGNFLSDTSDCGGAGVSLASGDAENGTYSEICTIPAASPNGTYTVELQAQDNAGNMLNLNSAGTFVVTGGGNVTSAPVLVSFTTDPPGVVAGSNTTIQWGLESVAGVSFTTIFIKTSDGNFLPACGGSGASLISGDAGNGTYAETCAISAAAPDGTYTVEVQAEDSAGNTLDLDSAGTFVVTGEAQVIAGSSSLSVSSSSSDDSFVRVGLACATERCSGILTLENPQSASTGARSSLTPVHLRALGSRSFSIPRTQERRVKIPLNSYGRSLLDGKSSHAVRIVLIESVRGTHEFTSFLSLPG